MCFSYVELYTRVRLMNSTFLHKYVQYIRLKYTSINTNIVLVTFILTEQNYLRTYVRYVYSTIRMHPRVVGGIRSTHRINCKHSHINTYQSLNNFAYLSGRSRDQCFVDDWWYVPYGRRMKRKKIEWHELISTNTYVGVKYVNLY